jgi:murein L,D-transpeptidase YcbB/YkuD
MISVAAFRLRADAAQEVWDLISSVASALGEGNAARFLAAFDPAMPGFETMRVDVRALLAGSEVQTAIDLAEREEDSGGGQSLELDWLVNITQREGPGRATRRRERVKCRVEKRGKQWRIVSFEPLGLFAPPRV